MGFSILTILIILQAPAGDLDTGNLRAGRYGWPDIARPICKCVLVFNLSVYSIYKGELSTGAGQKCLWTELDRPTTNQNVGTCDTSAVAMSAIY